MMPASLAVCSGSPLATWPLRISVSAAALIVMVPRASASRVVTAFSPTSTMRTRPRASTWESDFCGADPCGARGRLAITGLSLSEVERQALERHGQVDALQLHVGRHLESTGREIQDRLDARDHH